MKNRRALGFKIFGMIPVNEYTTANTDKNANFSAVSGQALLVDDMEHKHHQLKRRTKRPFSRPRSRGWLRKRSTNGWRAESASQQDEAEVDGDA